MGTHCSSLVLQQPEHRCTSTHGGHSRKLAFRRSNMDLVTSITSVRTLQAACWAGCASTRLLMYRPWVWFVRMSCSSSSSSIALVSCCSSSFRSSTEEMGEFLTRSTSDAGSGSPSALPSRRWAAKSAASSSSRTQDLMLPPSLWSRKRPAGHLAPRRPIPQLHRASSRLPCAGRWCKARTVKYPKCVTAYKRRLSKCLLTVTHTQARRLTLSIPLFENSLKETSRVAYRGTSAQCTVL